MAEISQIKLPNNTVLDLKDATARGALADMSKAHVIELEYYGTINNQSIYTSEVTNSEVKTMIDNGEVVILRLNKEDYYFGFYDRGVIDLTFFGYLSPVDSYRLLNPYKMNNSYTNYWAVYRYDVWAQPESSGAVNTMLANMGLSTTAYFNQATVGTAEPEHSIVQDIT